jgi:hypothetical protein
MGEETTRFKGCLICGMNWGGGGNDRQMQCDARAAVPWWARPRRCWEVAEASGGGIPLLRCKRWKKRSGGLSRPKG